VPTLAPRVKLTDMAASAAISVEEYLSTVYDPDCEYVDGEVLQRNMGEMIMAVFRDCWLPGC